LKKITMPSLSSHILRSPHRVPPRNIALLSSALGLVVAVVGCGDSTTTSATTAETTGSGTTAETSTGDLPTSTGPTTGTVTDTDSQLTTGSSGDPTDTSSTTDDSTSTGDSSTSTSDSSTSTSDSSTSTGDSSTSTGDSSTGTTGDPCESDDTVVKLGKLIDPVDGSVIEDALVVVHADRIVYVGTDEAQVPCGATVVDWSAYTGLPGLVDSHTHLRYQTDNEPDTKPWERATYLVINEPAKMAELSRQAAEKALEVGVTTVIDKGAGGSVGATIIAKLRDDIAAGQIVGPRVFTAGVGLGNGNASVTQIRNSIKAQVAAGNNLIKVWADGCSDKTLECAPNFTYEKLAAAVDEAHLWGKSIAIHAYHADTAKLAIMAGPDTLEHPEGLDAVDFMDMNALGITYVPTIDHNRYYKDNIDFFGYDPAIAADFDAYIALNLASTSSAHAAGVTIAMGSDAVFTGFGENTRELEWFIAAGMTPLEALRAATITGAYTVDAEHEIGRVAVEYYADIIAVDGDPLADITVVINGISGVMKGGKVVDL
jgi:imidazolonepropionase-like amidohydrolase